MGRSVLGSRIEAVNKYNEFVSLVKEMREAQRAYAEMFPTGYGCYAPTELETKVDEWIKEIEENHEL